MSAQASKDFVIWRVFDAPRERVWQAMTDVERMKEWWPPKTVTVIAATLDLSPGGSFHCGVKTVEGFKMWAKFVYTEVVPHEHVTFVNSFSNAAGEVKRHPIVPTWPMETLTTVKLEDEPGSKTKLTVIWSAHNATDAERTTFDVSHVGMKATWSGTFDRLAEFLAKAN